MCEIYRTGRVYKIIHTQSDIVYVGSTFSSLRERFRGHKNNKKENRNCSITPYIREYGVDQFKIILIKEYEVCDRKHLLMYETLWVNRLKCINKYVPFQPISMNERSKQYAKEHYEQRRIRRIKYREHENEQKREYMKNVYRFTHKEHIKEYKSRKIWCESCKCDINLSHKARHLKSQKHQKNMSQ